MLIRILYFCTYIFTLARETNNQLTNERMVMFYEESN